MSKKKMSREQEKAMFAKMNQGNRKNIKSYPTYSNRRMVNKSDRNVSVGPVLKGAIDDDYNYTVKVNESTSSGLVSTPRMFKTREEAEIFRKNFNKKGRNASVPKGLKKVNSLKIEGRQGYILDGSVPEGEDLDRWVDSGAKFNEKIVYVKVDKPSFKIGDKVRITEGRHKGESGVVMRDQGGGYYKVGHPSGHTEHKASNLEKKSKD